MDIAHVVVVSKEDQKRGANVLAAQVGIFFAVIVGYFAVVYWPVTLTVLGVMLTVAMIREFCS